MCNRFLALLCTCTLSLQMFPQDAPAPAPSDAKPQAAPTVPAEQANQAAPEYKAHTVPTPGKAAGMTVFGLQDATPVRMRTNRTISSADAKVGDTLDFEVLDEVRVNGVLVIQKGGIAWATITEAQPKRRMGRGGKLNVNVDNVRLADGEKVQLRAVKESQGGGHVGAMTTAMVATGIVFFPAAPLFLLMHGKDIVIPKGTEVTAYINGDTPLEFAKFQAEKPGVPAPDSTVK